MYKRKTKDIYSLYGLYDGKWEWLESSESKKELGCDLASYLENDKRPYRIVIKREKIK